VAGLSRAGSIGSKEVQKSDFVCASSGRSQSGATRNGLRPMMWGQIRACILGAKFRVGDQECDHVDGKVKQECQCEHP